MIAADRNDFAKTFDRIIPASLRASPVEWRAARNLAILAAIAAVSVPLLTMMYHLLGYDAAGMVVLTAGIVMMIAPFTLNAGVVLHVARDVFVGALYLLKVWMALHLGGLGAPTVPWFLLCPAIAMLLGGLRPGLLWCALVIATVVALFAIERAGMMPPAHAISDPAVLALASVLGLVVFMTIILALALQPLATDRRAR